MVIRSTLTWTLPVLFAAGCTIVTPTAKDNPASAFGSGGGSTMPFLNSLLTGATSSAGAGGAAGARPDGGADAAVSVPLTSYQYLCGDSTAACLPGADTDLCAPGGNPGLGGSPPGDSTFSCQLIPIDGGVGAECHSAGLGATGDPCSSASDCGAELGCVAGSHGSTCRPYCCSRLESCPSDTYCLASPMAGALENLIPVCVASAPCKLLGADCPLETTCAIVRESGTTSCVTPGPGKAGQACPCAAGFTCSFVDGICVELCHTNGGDCAASAYCQGGLASYPDGIGYCVSY